MTNRIHSRAILFVAGLAVFSAGCFSVDTASAPAFTSARMIATGARPLEHVVVSNYGWYLFNFIPLACGNASEDPLFPFVFFRNHVTADNVHDRLMRHASALNATVDELVFLDNGTVLFSIPGLEFPIPIPYVICYREMQLSAVLCRPNANEGRNER